MHPQPVAVAPPRAVQSGAPPLPEHPVPRPVQHPPMQSTPQGWGRPQQAAAPAPQPHPVPPPQQHNAPQSPQQHGAPPPRKDAGRQQPDDQRHQ
jgi:hypothetical protein